MSELQERTTGLVPSLLLAGGLLLLLMGERMFGEGAVRTTLSSAAAIAVLASVGLRLYALRRATADMRRAELVVLGCYLGVVAALVGFGLTADLLDGAILESSSRAHTIVTVLWVALMAVSLVTLLFVELVYARMPTARSVELRRVRGAASSGLALGLSLVFVFSINYVATERDIREDVSYFKTTKPSAGTLSMVEQLEVPVKVLAFYRRTDDVLDQIRPYFEQVAGASKQLEFEVVDFATAPELARTHRVRENGSVVLVRQEDEAQEPSAGAARPPGKPRSETLRIGTELTRARSQLRRLDGEFQKRFTKLTLPPRSLQLTVGHGERNATSAGGAAARGDGTRGLDRLLQRLNIESKTLGVADGLASKIPESAGAVAVIGPREPFLDSEAQTLLRYVQDGGRLLLLLDPGVDVGLEPLLHGLGLEMLPGVVASDRKYMRRTHTERDRTIVFSNNYSSHPAVTTANRLRSELASVFVDAAALERHGDTGELSPKPKVSFVMQSDGSFWRDLDGDYTLNGDEEKGAVNLIAAATFPKDKGGGEEGRALVIGDGDFVTDKLIPNAGNHLVFIDALAWLVGEEKITGGDVTSEEDIPIEHTRDQDQIWFYATTFLVPLPVLLVGIWVTRRRRRRSEVQS